MNMQLSEAQKYNLRARWRQNETDYLRDLRRKIDASAFIKLKTIGHGLYISLFGFHLSKLTFCGYTLRRFRGCVACERATHRPSICHETGTSIRPGLSVPA
jgi:hypothetical protein